VARLDSLEDDPALVLFRAGIKALSRTVTQFLLSSGADRLDISDDTQVTSTLSPKGPSHALRPLPC